MRVAKNRTHSKAYQKGWSLKSWNHTPELKIIKLLKRGGEVFFTASVERVRVKTKNYIHFERWKVFV